MELIIVTGLSGGGKTQALRCLEDMGYFCVDNLPCAMVGGFVQLCRDSKPPVEKAAVVIDSRESVFAGRCSRRICSYACCLSISIYCILNAATACLNGAITKAAARIRLTATYAKA